MRKGKFWRILPLAFLISLIFFLISAWPKIFGFPFGIREAWATNIASTATGGNWNATGSWTGGVVPVAGDNVTIAVNADIAVTADAACATLTWAGAQTTKTNHGITINAGFKLDISGAVTYVNPGAATTNRFINVLGTLNAASISMPTTGGNAQDCYLAIGNAGIVTVSGWIHMAATFLRNHIDITGAGTINIGGDVNNGGGTPAEGGGFSFTTAAGVINLNGTAAQSVFLYGGGTALGILSINNTAGVTSAEAMTVTTLTIGNITANSIFNDGGFVITPGTGSVLNLTSGKYKLGSATVGTPWPAWGTRNIIAGTTVEYGSDVAQTVSVTPAYKNLTFSGAGQKNVAGALSVTGDWSTTGGLASMTTSTATVTGNVIGTGAITFTSGTLAIGGNWTNNGTFTAGTSTVTYNTDTGNQTVGGITYNTLTLSNTSGTDTAGGGITATTLNTTNNGILNMGVYALVVTNVTNNGTIRTQNLTAAPLTASKTWAGTVQYDAAGGQTVVTGTYNNLTLSGSGDKTMTGIATINGNLTLSGTATATTAAVITLGGNIIIGTGTTLTIGANITVNGGNITVTSTGSLASSGTPKVTMGAAGAISGTGNVTIYDLTISASGTTVLSATGTNTITHDVAVSAGSTIDIQKSVAITGSITTTGTGIIDSTYGTPTVTVSGASIGGGSGNITFYNLTKSGAGTTTWTDATTNTVDNNLNISAGTFVAPAGTLYIGGNYSNSNIFTHSNGTVILNGSGQQTLSGTMIGANGQFYNLTIANSSGSITASCPTTSSFTPGVIFGAAVTVSNNYNIATTALVAGVFVQYNSTSTYAFNNISWVGTAAKKIYFRNSNLTSGTWVLNVTGSQNISYVDVASSNAGSYPQINAQITGTSTDCGSGSNANTNWVFIPIISVTITTVDKTIAYGNLAFGAQKSTLTLLQTKTAQNDGNVAEDFTIKTSNATGGVDWDLDFSPGPNVFVHEFSSNGGGDWTQFTTAGEYSLTKLATNVAINGTQDFDLRITTPTLSDAVQKTITITIMAVQHN